MISTGLDLSAANGLSIPIEGEISCTTSLSMTKSTRICIVLIVRDPDSSDLRESPER